ncbi:MAG: bifunctional diguanylate cyclase/phosphodiesterase [Lachnospiraceae bacterium]|nr:bifunctional diguanylate cyclase/phosphodiesterase [Lachnospiraceae bacterium]
MGRNHNKGKQVKKQRHIKGLLLLCLFLFLLSGAVFFGLNKTRKDLISECETNLLWDVQLTAKEVSEDIENKLAAMETVQELIVRSYGIGPDAIEGLQASKNRYKMSYLGLIDRDYVYYDSEGDVIPDKRSDYIETAMSGKKLIFRAEDDVTGDGVVFMVPCKEEEKVVGVLVAKAGREELLNKLSVKAQEGTELVVDVAGNVVLMSEDVGNYLEGMSWEEFSKNGAFWKDKPAFDKEMQLVGCSVASATRKSGKEIYFAAATIEGYEDFFAVRLTSSEVVEAEINGAMFWVYVMMVFMAFFMMSVFVAALIVYTRNRRAVYNAAYVDPLTGIPSKTKHKMDAQELIDKQERKYAYVTFDVDNFKYINEMFDYEYGNQILIHIAKTLKIFAKPGELYARVSSDNFALLLIDTGTKQELTDRIRELFALIPEYREPEEDLEVCALSFSCGVYQIEGKMDINTVRANANLARTESKKNVVDDITFYDENLKNRRVEEKELEYEAENALENKEFLVYFQPKYDVDSEKIIGAEALIRWNHPIRGMLSPNLFVPLFETNGFIIKLDLFVLDQVCVLIKSWIDAGIPPICISVNLSRIHLYERDIVSGLVEVVKKHDVPPEYIEFELTESAFYDETDSLLRVMSEIKEAGFRLSMDDFGSGYSSLNLLRRLPVDVLKLDRVFLEDCDEEDDGLRGKRIVMHVISMAKDLRMEVLAEGVETADQKDFLKDARCDMIQGYYYARPMPIKEFELLYKGQNCLKGAVHEPVVKTEEQDATEDSAQSEA